MNEIILYQSEEFSEKIEVIVESETVWLNRKQLSLLFGRDIKTIGRHINNALHEELNGLSVVAKYATTASDGKTYQVEHYNLDMVISVGYRVKSNRGISFRIWANKILKDYLMKGYSLNNRVNRIEDKMDNLAEKVEKIELQINTALPPKQGIFFDGQVYDAHAFVSDLIRTAQKEIVIIDNYVDDTVLTMLSKKNEEVKCKIYTKRVTNDLRLAADNFNSQYGNLELMIFDKSHDRFMIIDESDIYHIGASLKDLGKKWFAFSKMDGEFVGIMDKLS